MFKSLIFPKNSKFKNNINKIKIIKKIIKLKYLNKNFTYSMSNKNVLIQIKM